MPEHEHGQRLLSQLPTRREMISDGVANAGGSAWSGRAPVAPHVDRIHADPAREKMRDELAGLFHITLRVISPAMLEE
jgi:hypothetical protein